MNIGLPHHSIAFKGKSYGNLKRTVSGFPTDAPNNITKTPAKAKFEPFSMLGIGLIGCVGCCLMPLMLAAHFIGKIPGMKGLQKFNPLSWVINGTKAVTNFAGAAKRKITGK